MCRWIFKAKTALPWFFLPQSPILRVGGMERKTVVSVIDVKLNYTPPFSGQAHLAHTHFGCSSHLTGGLLTAHSFFTPVLAPMISKSEVYMENFFTGVPGEV